MQVAVHLSQLDNCSKVIDHRSPCLNWADASRCQYTWLYILCLWPSAASNERRRWWSANCNAIEVQKREQCLQIVMRAWHLSDSWKKKTVLVARYGFFLSSNTPSSPLMRATHDLNWIGELLEHSKPCQITLPFFPVLESRDENRTKLTFSATAWSRYGGAKAGARRQFLLGLSSSSSFRIFPLISKWKLLTRSITPSLCPCFAYHSTMTPLPFPWNSSSK